MARKSEPHKAPKRVKEVNGEERKMHIKQTDHIMLPRWGSGRMTPWDDRHIKCKSRVFRFLEIFKSNCKVYYLEKSTKIL